MAARCASSASPARGEGGGDWIRVEGDDPDEPGMHATDTLDFMVVVDGRIVLGLDDGEHELGPGDVVIQRGNRHRWRVVGDDPCTYVVCMLRPDPDAPPPAEPQLTATSCRRRRVRVGSSRPPTTHGRSYALADGTPPVRRSAAAARRWSSCGRPAARSARPTRAATPRARGSWNHDGGGDLLPDRGAPTRVRPRRGGVAHHRDHRRRHRALGAARALAPRPARRSSSVPGEAVVQRGTHHRWRPVGDEPVVWAAHACS